MVQQSFNRQTFRPCAAQFVSNETRVSRTLGSTLSLYYVPSPRYKAHRSMPCQNMRWYTRSSGILVEEGEYNWSDLDRRKKIEQKWECSTNRLGLGNERRTWELLDVCSGMG
ncbi:hypothetical protein T265_02441 [Opisthorchis viverrini]|uniref:Uncharacterized protein n=1 Tax=Opisthorchis viverrini TaxID=6198 RepID=A0A074ZUX1_OPIVI|nr:hypothetical protein T265_02441 [Opisthorchis viverrini]KER31248.1 hypothetical protein T265_02441 [Opisthorchis viverrini]